MNSGNNLVMCGDDRQNQSLSVRQRREGCDDSVDKDASCQFGLDDSAYGAAIR